MVSSQLSSIRFVLRHRACKYAQCISLGLVENAPHITKGTASLIKWHETIAIDTTELSVNLQCCQKLVISSAMQNVEHKV